MISNNYINDFGRNYGKSYGYIPLDFNQPDTKRVAGALAGTDVPTDIIPAGSLIPGRYYLKITLDVKDPTTKTYLNGRVISLQGNFSEAGIDIAAPEISEGYLGGEFIDLVYNGILPTPPSTVTAIEFVKNVNGRVQTVGGNIHWNGCVEFNGIMNVNNPLTGQQQSICAYVNCILPARREWNFTATNVTLGSVFKNLRNGDMITSAPGAVLLRGSSTVFNYRANTMTGQTDIQKIAYSGSGMAVIATDEANHLGLYGLCRSGQQVTVTDIVNGERTVTNYKVVMRNRIAQLQKTITTSDGMRTVSYSYVSPNLGVNAAQIEYNETDVSQSVIQANFNWTAQGTRTGYFAVSKDAAVVKAGRATITGKNADTAYIEITRSDYEASSPVFRQVHFNKETGHLEEDVTNQFHGKITIKAPANMPLYIDRSDLSSPSIDWSNTSIAVTDAKKGTVFNNLAAGDSLTTAALRAGDAVTVDYRTYTAVTGGRLGFQRRALETTFTQGTILMRNDNMEGSTWEVRIFDGSKTVPINVSSGSFTITANTNARGVTTYTLNKISANTEFYIDDVLYQRTATALLRKENGFVTGIYAMGTRNSITSAVLNTAANWKPVKDIAADGELDTAYGKPLVNLAAADKRFALDMKNGSTYSSSYFFTLDKYIPANTRSNPKNNLQTALAFNAAEWQVQIGQANNFNGKNVYEAELTKGQTIQVAKDWTVQDSSVDDTIIGAASGNDYIKSTGGNDTIKLGGAADIVEFRLYGNGNSTISGYASGKDSIIIDDFNDQFRVQLDTTGANVRICGDDQTQERVANLIGMGRGQAVTINGNQYYFGNGTLARNKKKTTIGAAFSYQKGAYYYGNDSDKNTLNVTKAASLADKADRVNIDMTATDSGKKHYYNNIDIVNATASAKAVDITAGDKGLRFTGSNYDDTITCGKGKDYIIYQPRKGNDTIRNFGVDDVLQINGLTAESIAAINAYTDGPLTLTTKIGQKTNTITMENMSVSRLSYDTKTKTVKGC